ncbi:glucose-6-phosphate dehydrogenase [Actinotalea sp. BY-33]|uniref:Glucose-6-phosphate 1-dehydrogenase n=1 Tax=Actinotalea soli TaxID=2819234 RepID=A0A939LNV0_9CELL|nr:glucose-6-phosphate dehydrogenase [Actinotalea soli]MBO1751381.1 glucose-6-phosphate dehydrogenase [Actinotalea soli]
MSDRSTTSPHDTDRTSTGSDAEGHQKPLILVLHGARGDLSRRLVFPALATLNRRGLLPEHWALLGTGRGAKTDEEMAEVIREALDEFGAGDDQVEDDAEVLTRHTRYAQEVTEEDPGTLPDVLDELHRTLEEAGSEGEVNVVHYLAIPPAAFIPATRALAAHDLTDGVRIVYEKPYGESPESFRELDAVVHEAFDEEQVFRIDHFLGMEATQNLHVLRFANDLFGTVWDRHHVEQVQIDVPETLDVAQRAEFYDGTGAALDMVVNHLFQVAAQVAMEPPRHLASTDLVRAREEVIGCFRPLDPTQDVVLGQFEGYRDIDGVAEDSTTDTFIAARLWIDNPRWQGVPFLLRTGKQMAASAQRVSLVLRRDPEKLFGDEVEHGVITLSLAGDGAIEITTTVKRPGPDLALATGTARLDLHDVDGDPLPSYASLLVDVLQGDRTLFTTPTGLEHAWQAFAPLLGEDRPEVHPYPRGSWGPAAAEDLASPVGWLLGRDDAS